MWKKAIGLDGELYDSESESRVADWLMGNGIVYEAHKKLPKPSRGFCDFYLPQFDLWIEYDGLMEVRTDLKLVKKEEFYRKRRMNFLIITRNDWETAILDKIDGG